jgi:hypothetical protein
MEPITKMVLFIIFASVVFLLPSVIGIYFLRQIKQPPHIIKPGKEEKL